MLGLRKDPDLVFPVLVFPDLAFPDLVSPDLVSSDLVSPDLISPDLVFPDLVSLRGWDGQVILKQSARTAERSIHVLFQPSLSRPVPLHLGHVIFNFLDLFFPDFVSPRFKLDSC